MATTSVLERLVAPRAHAAEVARTPALLKQWEGIAVILGRKMDMERKYIGRLEGKNDVGGVGVQRRQERVQCRTETTARSGERLY